MKSEVRQLKLKSDPTKTVARYFPVVDAEFEAEMKGTNNTGFCIACGSDQGGCEPDARRYECDSCGERKVYGLEELLLMNWVATPKEEEAPAQ